MINSSPALCSSAHSANVIGHLRLQEWLLALLVRDPSCIAS